MTRFDSFDLMIIILVALKLTGIIEWSWWLVLAPFLIDGLCSVVAVVRRLHDDHQ